MSDKEWRRLHTCGQQGADVPGVGGDRRHVSSLAHFFAQREGVAVSIDFYTLLKHKNLLTLFSSKLIIKKIIESLFSFEIQLNLIVPLAKSI